MAWSTLIKAVQQIFSSNHMHSRLEDSEWNLKFTLMRPIPPLMTQRFSSFQPSVDLVADPSLLKHNESFYPERLPRLSHDRSNFEKNKNSVDGASDKISSLSTLAIYFHFLPQSLMVSAEGGPQLVCPLHSSWSQTVSRNMHSSDVSTKEWQTKAAQQKIILTRLPDRNFPPKHRDCADFLRNMNRLH